MTIHLIPEKNTKNIAIRWFRYRTRNKVNRPTDIKPMSEHSVKAITFGNMH